jgi:hypothetical protein
MSAKDARCAVCRVGRTHGMLCRLCNRAWLASHEKRGASRVAQSCKRRIRALEKEMREAEDTARRAWITRRRDEHE